MAGWGTNKPEESNIGESRTRRNLRKGPYFRKPPANPPLMRKLYYRASNRILALRDEIQKEWLYETDTGTLFNFSPIFVALGIAIYFSVPAEPNLVAIMVALMVSLMLSTRVVTQGISHRIIIAVFLGFAGMLLGKISTTIHEAPVIERQITATISGTVIGVDQNSRGSPRYTIKPHAIGNLATSEIPEKIRLSASGKHAAIKPGEQITGLARIQPVSGPVYPGGYDFSFFAWFDGMGGSGFFMGAPEKVSMNITLGLQNRFQITVNRLRHGIEQRITLAMPKPASDIAIALVTGNKTGIPDDIQESLRSTGLAHILAISGLHMALVTLTVIWCVRVLMACSAKMALNYPLKKIAVCLGFASATFYLVISGAGVATQRAWIMISVMLLAVLLDKRAITIRSVAIAALLILLINPQSLFSPGFQMSFAAVASLVAAYEYLNKRRMKHDIRSNVPVFRNRFFMLIKTSLAYLAGIALTSLIAGLATGFIAAWHFHQIPVLGLLANLLAMPVVTTLVMPFVLASLLLMPYGMEFLPLSLVTLGIELVVNIAQYVETLAPVMHVGIRTHGTIIVFGLFLFLMTIPRTKLRFVSIGLLPFLFIFQDPPKPPDLLIAENGRAIAVKTEQNGLALLNTRAGSFVTNIWDKAWPDSSLGRLKLPTDQCNRDRCIHVMPNSDVLHIVYDPDLLQSSCHRADILVAPRLWWVNCRDRQPKLVLRRLDFEQHGTHALYANETDKDRKAGYIVKTALPEHRRPWHRNVRPRENVLKISDTAE